MAGLYIHIPFCSKRCLYCDFFSSTDLHFQKPFIDALIREMELRQNYLKQEPLETVYFGGGTPSLLPPETFNRLFDTIERLFGLGQCKEITLEANPDDLTPDYVAALRDLPFNRISMGIQSFQDKDLVFLNRRHTCRQAIQAVERCQANGLEEISIDLIYGLPGQTQTEWENNLEEALKLAVPHISAYHLTYEEGTALYKLLAAGKITPAGEEQSVSFFATLIDRLTASGYQHYEISNFALSGHHARHNSSYWKGTSYLGVGPSAHSYDGKSRQWNVSSLPLYIKGICAGHPNFEREELDEHTRYNEFVITRLRTMWGIRMDDVLQQFGVEQRDYLKQQAAAYIRQGLLNDSAGTLTLSRKGIFISDGIMSDLLWA